MRMVGWFVTTILTRCEPALFMGDLFLNRTYSWEGGEERDRVRRVGRER